MEIHPTPKVALEKINFLERYKYLSDEYRDFENRFEQFEIDLATAIINSFGYSSSYDEIESFFKIIERSGEFQFQFNIVLKGGIVELIWDVKKSGVRLRLAHGPWGSIAQVLSGGERIRLPIFTTYDELKDILNYVFDIYEDFKSLITKDQ